MDGKGEEEQEEEEEEEKEEEKKKNQKKTKRKREKGTDQTKERRVAGKRKTMPMSVRVSVGNPQYSECERRGIIRKADRSSTERAIISSIFESESRMGGIGVDVASFPRRHEGRRRRKRRRRRRWGRRRRERGNE